jgi:hypothetical protein
MRISLADAFPTRLSSRYWPSCNLPSNGPGSLGRVSPQPLRSKTLDSRL